MSEHKHSGHLTETPDTSHIQNLDVTHETSDVQVGSIAKFVVALTVLTIATCILMWGMFLLFNAREKTKETSSHRSPMALSDHERLPPEPRLQSAPAFAENLESSKPAEHAESSATTEADPSKPKDPLWEIEALHKRWHDVLEHGPVDQHGNRYGMPIEKAKEEVLKTLPVKKQ
jgi:hypothetical protein